MMKKLNLETWHRKDHFLFFKQFEEPFFGVSVNIDCTKGYETAREKNIPFFLYYLHKTLVACNHIEPFRYRICEEEVCVYERVNASPTINRPDGTFGFAYIDYIEDINLFKKEAQKVIDQVQQSKGLIPAVSGENIIHFSSIPWIKFTSVSHARSFAFRDSIPKISVGKITLENGIRTMPFSVHVHHGLMDGYHVGQFLEHFQTLMAE